MFSLISGSPAVNAMSSEAGSLYQEACTLEYNRDFAQAVEKIREAIKLSPDDAMLYTKLAGLYTDMDKFDEAIQAYQKVTELKPTDSFIYISMGSIYETRGQYDKALEAYQNALKIFPEYKYNYLNIANVQYQLKNYGEAIENFNMFLDTYSQHWEARKSLAASYLADNKPDKAVAEYDNLYMNNNADFDDYSNYGVALFKTKDYDKAVEMLEKAVEQDPENLNAKVSLALSYQNLDKNDLALAQFESVFKSNENLVSLKFDYANLLADMGNNEGAIGAYGEYIKAFPDDVRAYKNSAIVYQRQKDYENAIKNYEKVVAMGGDKDEMVLTELAACYHLQKDYKNAITYYDKALELAPNNVEILTNKAIALHADNRFADAIGLYEEVLKTKDSELVQNNLTDALVSQGNVELGNKNYEEAVKNYIKAISRGTKDSDAYYGLARAYRALEENDKATEFYEKAISMNPGNTKYSEDFAEFIADINKASAVAFEAGGEIKEITLRLDSSEATNIDLKYSKQNKELITEGDNLSKNKYYDEAIKKYKEALTLKPSDEVTLLKIGDNYNLKNDETNAIAYYKKSIFVNPEYADAWFNLGLVYAKQKNMSQCKKAFLKVIDINPDNAYAYYALAQAYEADEDNVNAVKYYEKFLDKNKDANMIKTVQEKITSLKK